MIEQIGTGATVRRTSSVSVQPLAWKTVNRRVAVADDTRALVVSELGESMVAVPEATLQVVETIGWSPGVAMPLRGKRVESPSAQRVRSGPASALGPIRSVIWIGSIKSSMLAELD